MKIKSLNIIDFGKFNDISFGPLDEKIVLFYGKNEAGKTTLFHLVKTLIFGFTPAKNDIHPYASWKNEKIEFSGVISSKQEDTIHLYRRLLSSPKGQITLNDKVVELRNNPLPFANHISWEIYNKIYALKVEDLVEIQGKAWDEVQDKLLANYGNINIKNTREIVKELNDEANKLFRESGRGKTLIKELESQIRDLKKEKTQALERQIILKNNDQRWNEIKEKIKEMMDNKIIIRTHLKKAKVLVPIKRMLEERETLNSKLIDKGLFLSLPTNAGDRLKELEEKKHQVQNELEKRKERLFEKKAKQHVFSKEEDLILANKDEIEEHHKGLLKLEGMIEEKNTVEEEHNKLKDRLTHEARNLLNGDVTEKTTNKIKELNLPELRLIITSYQKIKADLKEIEGLLQYQQQQQKNIKTSNAYIFATIIGFLLITLAVLLNQTPLLVIGGIALVYGFTDWFNGKRIKKQLMREMSGSNNGRQLEGKKAQLTKEMNEQREGLINKFLEIPIPPLVLENINELFLTNLVKVKDLIFEVEEKYKILKEKNNIVTQYSLNLSTFLNQFVFDVLDEKTQINHLKKMVEALKNKKSANVNLEDDIKQLDKEVTQLQQNYRQVENEIEEIQKVLLEIGEGSLEKGLSIFNENQQLQLKINVIEERLREITDLEVIMKEIDIYEKNHPWVFSEIELERAENKIEELEENLQSAKEEKKELEIKNEALLKTVTVDEIESKIFMLETELQEVCVKRDGLMLLREVIMKAEEIYKEENQPDVLKNASKYLNIITGGRYSTIYLEETNEGTIILLKEKDNPIPRPVSESFSKGTLNQLYLSLRLSLIDHLDRNGETLPICFDELLINWDEERLENNIELLKEIGKHRQIFMFTCHDWMARKMESSFGVKRIQLN